MLGFDNASWLGSTKTHAPPQQQPAGDQKNLAFDTRLHRFLSAISSCITPFMLQKSSSTTSGSTPVSVCFLANWFFFLGNAKPPTILSSMIAEAREIRENMNLRHTNMNANAVKQPTVDSVSIWRFYIDYTLNPYKWFFFFLKYNMFIHMITLTSLLYCFTCLYRKIIFSLILKFLFIYFF